MTRVVSDMLPEPYRPTRADHSLPQLVWLTEEERELAFTRLPQAEHVKMTFATLGASIRRAVSTWRWYLFTLLFTVSATAFEKVGVYTEFNLWLKSTGTYTTTQINYYPSIFTAVRGVT